MGGAEFSPGDEGAADAVDRLDDGGEAERSDWIAPDQRERAAEEVADTQRGHRDSARGGRRRLTGPLAVRGWLAIRRRLAVAGWLAVGRGLSVRGWLAIRRGL